MGFPFVSMPEKELIGTFYEDVPAWERAPVISLLRALARIRTVRIEEGPISAGRGSLIWVIGRDWKRALAAAKKSRADRYFVSLMGAGGRPPSLPTLFVRKFRPLISNRVHLLTHSQLNYRFFREIEGMPESQLSCLNLPCPEIPVKDRGNHPGFTVGVLSPFTRDSNMNYLVNVAHYVTSRLPQVRFRIFGEGRLEAHAKNMIQDLGLEGKVTLEAGEGAEQLSQVDVCVFAPLRNHHFVPLQWAAAHRLPVVCSEVPGIEGFVKEGHSGFVVPINETKPMGELLMRVLRDPTMAQAMGNRLHDELTERYSARRLLNLFDEFFFGTGSTFSPAVQAA